MKKIQYHSSTFLKKLDKFCRSQQAQIPKLCDDVAKILDDVKKRGDQAVTEWTAKIDKVSITPKQYAIPPEELRLATKQLSVIHRRTIKRAIESIEDFHQKCLPKTWREINPHGAIVGELYYPLERIGIWIPGGSTPLVSTVMMTVGPAKLAKVPEVVVCTPPQAGGGINPMLMAMLHFFRIKEVYCIGGVPAIAAMAYGTKTIRPVHKIFGPGNAYIVEAKRQVFGQVGIDLLPGPSEMMILSDGTGRADYAAADLLAQAEHGSGNERLFLVSTDSNWIEQVKAAIREQLPRLNNHPSIRTVLDKSFLIVETENLDQAAEVANTIAPEHLGLHVAKKHFTALTKKIRTAGSILLGDETPAAAGDFAAGPSHTLPTGGTGRFSSGLQISDFLRRTSLVEYNSRNLSHAESIIYTFSRLEKLDAHAASVKLRMID